MIRAMFRRQPAAAARSPLPGMARDRLWPPVLETDRLVLRVAGPQDFEGFAAFFATERSAFVGGPVDREPAWRLLGTIIGHWTLRGWGSFVVVPRNGSAAVGIVGPWFPEGWPEPELGWMLWDANLEGRGLMREAAEASRAFAYRDLGWTTAVSYISPQNVRSTALAERLGARPDPGARQHTGDAHVVWRHPAPEALA